MHVFHPFPQQPWVCPVWLQGKLLETVSREWWTDELRTQEICHRASPVATALGIVLNTYPEGSSPARCSSHTRTQIIKILKGQEEHWGGDGCVYDLDGGAAFMAVYLTPNSLSCVH